MQSVSGTPTPGDWQQAAREAAQGAVQSMDSFRLVGVHSKRMADAEAALEQMDSLQAGGERPLHAAVEMIRAVSAAAISSPKDQELAVRTALESIAVNGAASVAGGATPLATLAIRILADVRQEAQAKERKAPTTGMADAAFSAIASTASTDWIMFVQGLSGFGGQGRLELAARPLEECSVVDAAGRVAAGVGLDMDHRSRLEFVRHAVDHLAARSASEGHASAPYFALLQQWAATTPVDSKSFTQALVSGVQAAVHDKASLASVSRAALQRLGNGPDAAAVGCAAVNAMPASGWGAWGRMALAAVTDPSSQAMVARAAVDGELQGSACTPEKVAVATENLLDCLERSDALPLARPLADALQAVAAGSPQAASVAEVRAMAGRMGLDDLETAQAVVAMCKPADNAPVPGAPGASAVSLADLSRVGQALALSRMDGERAGTVAAGLLHEAASLVTANQDAAGERGVRMLTAALDASTSASRRASVCADLVDVLGRLPRDLKAAASLSCELVDLMPRPERGLDMLAAALPEVQAFSTDPPAAEMVGVLRSAVAIEPYEAETLLRGVRRGLETLADPPQVEGSALANFVERVAGSMNYWVDEAAVLQAGRDALAREATRLGDVALGDSVRFMQRVDDHVDVSTEKERVAVQRKALDWLAEQSTATRGSVGCLREMAVQMRSATESQMRDLRAGEVAAEVMQEVAARDQRQDLKHEAGLLLFLADRHAENVGERLEALYDAMEAQGKSTATGGQKLAEMARAAMECYKPHQDQVLVARGALKAIEEAAAEGGQEGTARMAGALRGLSEVRLDGEKPRMQLAVALMDALARTADAAPGTLASVGRTLLESIDASNARAFSGPLLEAIQALAASAGEKVYVPDLLETLRRDLGAATDDEAWSERLGRGLQELERFQGEGLAHAVSAGRVQGRDPAEAPQIQSSDEGVVIGGIKVPVRGREA